MYVHTLFILELNINIISLSKNSSHSCSWCQAYQTTFLIMEFTAEPIFSLNWLIIWSGILKPESLIYSRTKKAARLDMVLFRPSIWAILANSPVQEIVRSRISSPRGSSVEERHLTNKCYQLKDHPVWRLLNLPIFPNIYLLSKCSRWKKERSNVWFNF